MRDPRLEVIKEFILEQAQHYKVPANEIHLNLSEPTANMLTVWQYNHKPSSKYINILNLKWKNLDTKKVK